MENKLTEEFIGEYRVTVEELKEMVDAYLTGIYTYEQMADMFHFNFYIIKDVFNSEYLIEKHLGHDTYKKLRERANFVIQVGHGRGNNEVIRNHKSRKIIKESILQVSAYEKKIIDTVTLFLEFDGNSELVAEKTGKDKNEVNSLLQTELIKEFLLPEAYEDFSKKIYFDSIFINRNHRLIKENVDKIIYLSEVMEYKVNTIAAVLDLPVTIIDRFLNDQYTKVKIQTFRKNVLSDDERELVMAEHVISFIDLKGASLEQIAEVFNVSVSTIKKLINIGFKDATKTKCKYLEGFKKKNR